MPPDCKEVFLIPYSADIRKGNRHTTLLLKNTLARYMSCIHL
jgi:hypothetical protein